MGHGRGGRSSRRCKRSVISSAKKLGRKIYNVTGGVFKICFWYLGYVFITLPIHSPKGETERTPSKSFDTAFDKRRYSDRFVFMVALKSPTGSTGTTGKTNSGFRSVDRAQTRISKLIPKRGSSYVYTHAHARRNRTESACFPKRHESYRRYARRAHNPDTTATGNGKTLIVSEGYYVWNHCQPQKSLENKCARIRVDRTRRHFLKQNSERYGRMSSKLFPRYILRPAG